MDDAPPARTSREVIGDIVAGLLRKKGRPLAAPSDDLREAGLSSLDMVNLMLAVEDSFDLTLPQEKMTPENFRSIDAIALTVAGLA
jgi:acyl carrier protein